MCPVWTGHIEAETIRSPVRRSEVPNTSNMDWVRWNWTEVPVRLSELSTCPIWTGHVEVGTEVPVRQANHQRIQYGLGALEWDRGPCSPKRALNVSSMDWARLNGEQSPCSLRRTLTTCPIRTEHVEVETTQSPVRRSEPSTRPIWTGHVGMGTEVPVRMSEPSTCPVWTGHVGYGDLSPCSPKRTLNVSNTDWAR